MWLRQEKRPSPTARRAGSHSDPHPPTQPQNLPERSWGATGLPGCQAGLAMVFYNTGAWYSSAELSTLVYTPAEKYNE